MESESPTSSHCHHLRLDTAGRVVIPADVRRRLGVTSGDPVLLIEDAEGLHIKTQQQALKDLQEYFRKLLPEGVSLADELIADRRAEVARECGEPESKRTERE